MEDGRERGRGKGEDAVGALVVGTHVFRGHRMWLRDRKIDRQTDR